jgi:hypothetical protein
VRSCTPRGVAKFHNYLITGELTISVCTEVRAESLAQAKRIAANRSAMTLCHRCSGDEHVNEEWVTSGELDGEPKNLVGKERRS